MSVARVLIEVDIPNMTIEELEAARDNAPNDFFLSRNRILMDEACLEKDVVDDSFFVFRLWGYL